jgi:nucleoside-diphosphate-sugar epimerase
MKILVVGGAGYVGSVMVPRLLKHGYEVDVVDLLWFGNHLPKEVGIVQKDVLDLKEEDVAAYDQVIFVAGMSNDPMAEFSPSRNFISNGAAPAYLAYITKQARVKRYIYGSSCSVYGFKVDELCDENSVPESSYPYGISKLQGEFASLQLRDDAFSVIALRQGTVCGYSPRMRLDLVVNTMLKTAVEEGTISVNNPAIWRPILAVQDAAAAYLRAVESSMDISGAFNVTSGNYTVGEIADHVAEGIREYLGRDPRIVVNNVRDLRSYKVSIAKAENVLSFKPTCTIKDIVKELIDNLDKFRDFENPLYYNIRVFKSLP